MTDDYFESDEFKESHSLYLKMKREGVSCYLDSDEFINISDYYVELGNIDEAEDVLAKENSSGKETVTPEKGIIARIVGFFKYLIGNPDKVVQ